MEMPLRVVVLPLSLRRHPLLALAPTYLLAAGGCDGMPSPGSADVEVVVSVLPHAWLADRVAGGGPPARVMIPPGANEATYEPTVEQLRAVSGAAVYLAVGHPHFAWERTWLGRLRAANPDLVVVDGSEGCRRLAEDPHVWLSPSCVRVTAARLAEELGDSYPGRRAELTENLAALDREVEALDAELRERLAPYRGRSFLVFHPAWGYFAAEYGLRQVAIQRGALEPSTRELGELIERARADGMRTVFVQPQFSTAAAELVAGEIGGQVVALDPLARDWPASLRRAAEALVESFRP